MDFRTRFRIDNTANSLNPTVGNHTSNATENLVVCTGTNQIFDKTTRVYCYLCVYQGFISLIRTLSTVFWTVCICVHYFILVSCQNHKLASHMTCILCDCMACSTGDLFVVIIP